MSIMADRRTSRAPAYAFIGALALLLYLVTQMILPYLMAILMGQILALIAQKPYRFLRIRGVGAYIAGSVVAIGMIVLVIAPLVGFTIVAARQAVTLGQWLASADHSGLVDVMTNVLHSTPVQAVVGEEFDLVHAIREQASSIGAQVSFMILELAKGAPAAILQLFLSTLAGFYLLVDGERFARWVAGKLPFDQNLRRQVLDSFRDTAISVVWASMIAASVQAALMTIGFAVLKVPGAFLAGGATFIFAWVPLLGSMPVLAAGLAYLAIQGAYTKLALMLVIGGIAGIADNFVRPMVLGGRGEMHPMVSLVAIFGGINMFGIFGVFVGPILAAVLITLLQIWPIVGRQAGLEFSEKVDS
jgi:predicted PurR-regulated permease PerM